MNQFRTNYQILMEKKKELEAKIQNMPDKARKVLTAQLDSCEACVPKIGYETANGMLETVYAYVK